MAEFDPLISKVRTARILKFLLKNGLSTVRQIAKYMGNITENRLYYLLSVMEKSGLVIDCGWTKPGKGTGQGRTAKKWKVSEDPKVKEFIKILEI